jgi:hypothetical protein
MKLMIRPAFVARLAYDVATPFYRQTGLTVPAWEQFTEHQQAMTNRVLQHLNGHSHEAAHGRWVARLSREHWRLGPERSYIHKTHPHLKAFARLSEKEKTGHAIVELFSSGFIRACRQDNMISEHELLVLTETGATRCAERIEAVWQFGEPFRQHFIQHALQRARELMLESPDIIHTSVDV